MRYTDPHTYLSAIQLIVEERVRQADEQGLFDDLPGRGKPLDLESDAHIAPHLRVSYRILKNAGILPPEMQARREISDLRALLAATDNEEEARRLVKEINDKILACNVVSGFSIDTDLDQLYADKIVERIGSRRIRIRSGKV